MVKFHLVAATAIAAFVVDSQLALAQNAALPKILPPYAQQSPVQQNPVTTSPPTTAPVTTIPATKAPVTSAPATTTPATTTPATTAPVTKAPTPAPTTLVTPAPTTPLAPNWIGALKGKPIDNACYRKSYITKNKQCGTGYEFDKVATCWAQCPIEYPVECGMECLPQNADCTLAVLRKVTSVANVALNLATSGVFGELTKASKGVQTGVKCGQHLLGVVEKVVGNIKEIENGGVKADTTKDQLITMLMKADVAVYDVPATIAVCMGRPVPTSLETSKEVLTKVQTIVSTIVDSTSGGANILEPTNFIKFASDLGIGKSVASLAPTEMDTLKKIVGTGVTCGTKLKSVVDKIVVSVGELKKSNPSSTVDVIKFAILNSDIVLKDVPDATIGCVNANAPDNMRSRDDILKFVHTVIDKVVEASSQNGNPVSIDKYAISIANMGLDAIATFDPTGIAAMAAEFIEPICGPTAYVGDVDDGPADKALGLTTVQKAFRGSNGSWLKSGDGQLRITFKSVDDKDVKVNIKSGGNKVYEVKVGKGQTVEWTKPLSEFGGKTLYLDRWRAGLFGIPGTGGGSLLTWVPSGSNGSLKLEVKINPTSFSDHDRERRRLRK